MTFQIEFPDYPAADAPELDSGWQDVSWHNDICPSWFNPTLGAYLFADYVEIELREFLDSEPRFTVRYADADGCILQGGETYSTNSLADALAYAAHMRPLA